MEESGFSATREAESGECGVRLSFDRGTVVVEYTNQNTTTPFFRSPMPAYENSFRRLEQRREGLALPVELSEKINQFKKKFVKPDSVDPIDWFENLFSEQHADLETFQELNKDIFELNSHSIEKRPQADLAEDCGDLTADLNEISKGIKALDAAELHTDKYQGLASRCESLKIRWKETNDQISVLQTQYRELIDNPLPGPPDPEPKEQQPPLSRLNHTLEDLFFSNMMPQQMMLIESLNDSLTARLDRKCSELEEMIELFRLEMTSVHERTNRGLSQIKDRTELLTRKSDSRRSLEANEKGIK
jgi:hypothetical protein